MRLPTLPLLLLTILLSTTHIAAQGNFPKLSSPDGGSSTTSPPSKSSSSAASSSAASSTASNSASTPTSGSATSSQAKLPSLTSSTATYDGITNAPKITNPVDNGGGIIYTYPAPSVPPTANAPFMQHSTAPSGTVFIGVGAALGFCFAVVIAWRGLVAWSLYRSIQRVNNPPQKYNAIGDAGSSMLRNAAPFYKNKPGSQMSLDQLGSIGKTGPKPMPTNTNLFFSPTAGAGMHQPGNRHSSAYLPAGYYAAGNSVPGARPISMADLNPRPQSQGYPQNQGYQRARSMGHSPPISPSLPPNHGGDNPYARSSLSLQAQNQGRAPSAYLDDLFDVPPIPERGGPTDYRY